MTLPFKIELSPKVKIIENQLHSLTSVAKMYEFFLSHSDKFIASFKPQPNGTIIIYVDQL
jgi:hypothetical protein